MVRPIVPNLSITEWVRTNAASLDDALLRHGALLLRGFARTDIPAFEAFVTASSGPLLDYRNRSTPRSRVAGRVFTSTEYPADQTIPQHNEMSYTDAWPQRICFACMVAPRLGGETPIADSARVLARIPAERRSRFERDGVMYVRNYGREFDLPWQEVFQTEDRAVVDRYCREHSMQIEWLPDDRLRTSQVAQATVTHPLTGEAVWFNQAHLFHTSSLPSDVRGELERQFAPQDLPRNALYGDGSPIEVGALDIVRAAYAAEEIALPWEEGDIMLLDNVQMSHGRRPFSGPRSIVVAMT
jgi:alpha-ketoglutarate-dependent taurine dioxygenase